MPKGNEFTVEEKVLIFKVIRFCEHEKEGPIIPLYNTVERIAKILDISERSVYRLKKEMNELMQQQQKELEEEQEQKQLEEQEVNEHKRQVRNKTNLASTLQYDSMVPVIPEPKRLHRRLRHSRSSTINTDDLPVPQPYSAQKRSQYYCIVRMNRDEIYKVFI